MNETSDSEEERKKYREGGEKGSWRGPRQRSDSASEYRITMSSDSETLASDILASKCPKAKEVMEFDSNCCGICLLEDGSAIRGWIDTCDHFFCFVCIMEWAKVESRCPMCKRRFSNIRRPPRPGVFPSERIVNVPVRDQVSLFGFFFFFFFSFLFFVFFFLVWFFDELGFDSSGIIDSPFF